ncbi:hypothetical protein [Pseudoalteromonas sp. NBT06-2]|uniref:hypothetical protein n=1 Tax=Pseudoalteromonas sp. NBT06-2 TaxID=2025950 RepID=UPI0011410253|nr:hypothetical protein [Pseudoalteromonas sp. NBT06-2]
MTKKPNFHVTKYLAGIEKPGEFSDPNALLQKQIQEQIQQQLAKAFESGVIQVPATATTADFMNAALQQQNAIAQTVAESQSQDSNND